MPLEHPALPGRAACALAAAALCACTTMQPVVPPAPLCAVPASMTPACAAPAALAPDLTYGELLLRHQADRTSLEACAARQQALVRHVQACRSEMERYNASLGARGQPSAPGAPR